MFKILSRDKLRFVIPLVFSVIGIVLFIVSFFFTLKVMQVLLVEEKSKEASILINENIIKKASQLLQEGTVLD